MSYTLNHTNGALLTTVLDGSIDNTTSLTFVGKNYSGYGQIVNQDLVKLLENFAGATQPTKSIAGQVWYDTGNKKIKFYTGSRYKQIGSIESGNNYPIDMTDGDLFWNVSEQRLYIFDASYATWRIVGPQFTPAQQANSITYANVYDTNGFTHNILKYQMVNSNNVSIVTAISSPDADFTLAGTNPISGFSAIKQGITLNGTDPITGVSSSFILWGTANNTIKLNGQTSDKFVTVANPNVSGQFTSTNDLGININGITRLDNNFGVTRLSNLSDGGKVTVYSLKSTQLYDVANFGTQGTGGRLAITPSIIPGQSTDIGATNAPFAFGYINTVTSKTIGTTNITAQNMYADNTNGQLNTVGTPAIPFDTIYGIQFNQVDPVQGALPVVIGANSKPASMSSTGTQGQMFVDGTGLYVCIATNTWRKISLSTF
jgi:hypothetical protein